jgi:nucleotide-binding universal stress UspA family protein
VTILVAYVPRPEGEAALDKGIELAQRNQERLVVLNVSLNGKEDASTLATVQDEERIEKMLQSSGVDGQFKQFVRGKNALTEIEELVEKLPASLLIIGLRKRTAVGKLILGSVARDILLSVSCPVLAVKAL